MKVIKVSLVISSLMLLVLMGCASQEPVPTPEVATLCNETHESGEFAEVIDSLGYALSPSYLPDGFQSLRVAVSGGTVRHVLTNGPNQIVLAYPVEFQPEGSPTMRDLGFVQPEDVVEEVSLSGDTGHIMRGGWSDETILAGPGLDPNEAIWDYQKSITLFFDCDLDDTNQVGVAIQALNNSSDWASESELLKMALSIARIIGPQGTQQG